MRGIGDGQSGFLSTFSLYGGKSRNVSVSILFISEFEEIGVAEKLPQG